MERIEFLLELKRVIESKDGCYIKTTPKKGYGFVPYNRHGIKCGQVDADNPTRIRIVFDWKPGSFDLEAFVNETGLEEVPRRKWVTGYRFTEAKEANDLDQLIVFLEEDFIANNKTVSGMILTTWSSFIEQSEFKTQSSGA